MSFFELSIITQVSIVIFTPIIFVILFNLYNPLIKFVRSKIKSFNSNYKYIPLNKNVFSLLWYDLIEVFLYDLEYWFWICQYKILYCRYLPRFYSKTKLELLYKKYPNFFEVDKYFAYDFPNLQLRLSRVETKYYVKSYYPNKILKSSSLFNSEYVYLLEKIYDSGKIFVNPYCIFYVLNNLHKYETKKELKTKPNNKMNNDIKSVSKFLEKTNQVLDEKDLTF